MSEFELKFAIPPRRFKLLAAEVKRRSRRLPLTASYFDTPDHRLANAGVSLRLRSVGATWTQTATAQGHGIAEREEGNVPLPASAVRGEPPEPEPSLHRGSPAGRALLRALGDGDELLQPEFRTEVIRHHRLLSLGTAQIELALDEGRILAGPHRETVRELELKLKAGSPTALFALARRWITQHGLWQEARSKAERGRWLARNEPGDPPQNVDAGDPRRVRASRCGEELLRELLRSSLSQVIVYASEVAAGRGSAEQVHQLRVGLRRVRTALRVFGGSMPTLCGCEAPLAKVFRALGSWRDAEVMHQEIEPQLRDAGAPELRVEDAPRTAGPSPGKLARETGFQLALITLMEFVQAPPGFSSDAAADHCGSDLDAVIEQELSRLHKQVRRDGPRFDALARDEQHRVRKRLKRLRYLAEFVAPRYKQGAVRRYLRVLKPAQEALGAHNDTAVTLERYRDLARSNANALFAVGWLTRRLEQTACESRLALGALNDIQRFWR